MRLLAFLKKHEGSIQTWTDSLSHVAQVIALVLAGFWAYSTFYLTEKPGLEPRGLTEAELRWDPLPDAKDVCLAVFRVTFHNIGKRSINVTHVRIIGWLSDRLSGVAKPRLIEVNDLEHGESFLDRTFPKATLIGH